MRASYNFYAAESFSNLKQKTKIGWPIILLTLFVFCLVLNFPTYSYAATVTPRIELNGDPGQALKETVRIFNEERSSKTFYITFENFQSVDETGNPFFTNRKEDLATWLEAPESVIVGPGESRDITVTVRIPLNAEPGGHFSAIFFQTTPPDESQGSQVGLSSKLGTLVLLRVGGDFTQAANIVEFSTKGKQKFFNSLPIYFNYRFQNTGDDHLKPLGDVLITNTFGGTAKILPANPIDGSVLPKSIRKLETFWFTSGKPTKEDTTRTVSLPPAKGFFAKAGYQWTHFAFGKYQAKLKLAFGTKQLQSANATFTFFVFPWQLLSIIIVLLIIVLLVLYFVIRRYNRYIINRAIAGRKNKGRRGNN